MRILPIAVHFYGSHATLKPLAEPDALRHRIQCTLVNSEGLGGPRMTRGSAQRRWSMWLEEMVWLWLPLAGGVGLWMMLSIIMLKRDVRALRHRLAQLEAESSAQAPQEAMPV